MAIRKFRGTHNRFLPKDTSFRMQIYEEIFNNCVPFQHCDTDGHSDAHIINLCKKIIETYVNTRMFHEAKMATSGGNSVRQKYTKLILFKNQ